MKKKLLSILMLCGILSLMSSCKKETLTAETIFVENTHFGSCFLGAVEDRTKIVIRTQKEYQTFMESRRSTGIGTDCASAVPTAIDFDEFSLIGTQTSGGCSATYNRSVKKEGSEIIYNITVEYSGFCLSLVSSMNWALVPKLRNRDEVIFNVTEIDL